MVEPLKILGAVMLAAFLCACSAKTTPNVRDSNSNWLATCDVTADCDGDGACICGLCTATCRDDEDCESAGPWASCVRPDEASGEVACAAIVESAGQNVCLAECDDDDDCRSGSSCEDGACWASPASVIDRRDSGAAREPILDAAIDAASPLGIDMRPDLWELDASVDFSEPVASPLPQTELTGELAASLIGVWTEVGVAFRYWSSPLRLEIVQDSRGRITGTVTFLCAQGDCFPRGPFPVATDPNAGYPPGADFDSLGGSRTQGMAHVPYPLLDGRVQNGRLTFRITHNEVWRDWCALQTPHPVTVDGRQTYACMPDPPVFWDIIFAKGLAPKELLCAIDWSPCRCTAQGCVIDYHASVREFDVKLFGDDELSGFHQGQYERLQVTLRREGSAP